MGLILLPEPAELSVNSSNEKSDFVSSSRDKQVGRKRMDSESCIFRRFIRRQASESVSSHSEGGRHLESLPSDASHEELGSCRRVDGERSLSSGEFVTDNSTLLSLQPWIFRKENYHQEDRIDVKGNSGFVDNYGCDMNEYAHDLHSQLSPRNSDRAFRFGRSKSSHRRRSHRNSVKPLTSMENCLIPQLYKDHFEIEDYGLSPLPSPASPAISPFVINNENQIISKSCYDPFDLQILRGVDGVNSRVGETVTGVPPLPESRKLKRRSEEMQHATLKNSRSDLFDKTSQLQGSPEGMLLFCVGISIGVMSTFLSNKREVNKLNDLLRHTQNLVQDLQEELEMKDSLTVKELLGYSCENQELNDNCAHMEEHANFHNQISNVDALDLKIDDLDQPQSSKAGENTESMTKIEAELEAELERLELNLGASSLGGRMSALAELDPEFVVDVVQGELRADRLKSGGLYIKSDVDTNGSSGRSTTPAHSVNYSVSPTKLSLRLHELIQSRLEERIEELETALYHTQKELHLLEADKVNSEKDFSNGERGFVSNPETPTTMEQVQAMDYPSCLNLSGDALDEYDEAYDEFIRIAETEEEDLSSSVNVSEPTGRNDLCLSDQSLPCVQEGDKANGFLPEGDIYEMESALEQMFRNQPDELCGTDEDVNEIEDIDDEEGRMLIQQIVEKTRQGSPAVLNAQRMLLSMHE